MEKNYYYTQVSILDQGFEKQMAIIHQMGIAETEVFIDYKDENGVERENYFKLKQLLRPEDILNIDSINALGENLGEIVREWQEITLNGINIRVLDMPLIDTTLYKGLTGNYISEVVVQLFTYFLEQEKEQVKNKQAKGIQKARKNGVILGRPKAQLPPNFNQVYFKWKNMQITAVEAMKQLGLKKALFIN